MSATLTVKGLKAGVGEKEILHGIDLVINPGETHVFMGPNGAGKSTLGNAIMGHPAYEVTEGSIQYGDLDLLEGKTDEANELQITKIYASLAKYFPSWVGYNMAKCGGCIRGCVSMLEKKGGCMEGRFHEPLRTKKPWRLDR